MYVWRTVRHVRPVTAAVEKKCVTYPECVAVALGIHQAMSVHQLPSVACPAVQYFSTLSHRRHDFLKKTLLSMKCELWFSLQFLSETFLILRRTERDIITKEYWSSSKVPVIIAMF